MSEIIKLDGFKTNEIAVASKPISQILKDSQGTIISYSKVDVKKNLLALVRKHKKEIDALIKNEILTVKEEKRLVELRGLYKEGRLTLKKITEHNSSVLAQASKSGKTVKDELTLILQPVEDRITVRLDAEEKRREDARKAKDEEETKRKEKIETYIETVKNDLDKIIGLTVTFSDIEKQQKQFKAVIDISADLVEREEGINLEELQVDYDTMIADKKEEYDTKIKGLETANELEISKLTNTRMAELFDYDFKYKGETSLGELGEEEYAEILIPERITFRTKQLEVLGFTKSETAECYVYIPNETVILCEAQLGTIKVADNETWDSLMANYESEISIYNTPAEVEVEEETPAADSEEVKAATVSTGGGSIYFMKSVIPVEQVDLGAAGGDTRAETVIDNRIITPMRQLIELLDSRGFTAAFIEETMKPFVVLEREAFINAYNDGQTDTINILIEEIEKEAPELMEGMKAQFAENINKLDAIEYYNEKYKSE